MSLTAGQCSYSALAEKRNGPERPSGVFAPVRAVVGNASRNPNLTICEIAESFRAGRSHRCRAPKRLSAPEYQIAGRTPLPHGLGLIARSDEFRPRHAPVRGALGGPGKIRRTRKQQQCPVGIVRPVARETEFTARPDDAS